MVDSRYHDRWIECLPDRIQIPGTTFPGAPSASLTARFVRSGESEWVPSVEEGGSGVQRTRAIGRAWTRNGQRRASGSFSMWAATYIPS